MELFLRFFWNQVICVIFVEIFHFHSVLFQKWQLNPPPSDRKKILKIVLNHANGPIEQQNPPEFTYSSKNLPWPPFWRFNVLCPPGLCTSDVRAQSRGKKSDSFSDYFYKIWKKGVNGHESPSRVQTRELFSYETFWVGNNVSLNRCYGTSKCGLCARERMEILKSSDNLKDVSQLINYKSEIYFSCRHKPKILKFVRIAWNFLKGYTDEQQMQKI